MRNAIVAAILVTASVGVVAAPAGIVAARAVSTKSVISRPAPVARSLAAQYRAVPTVSMTVLWRQLFGTSGPYSEAPETGTGSGQSQKR